MDEKMLKDGIIVFLQGLYYYKLQEENLLESSRKANDIIKAFHDKGVIEDLSTKEILPMLKNKFTFLINELEKIDVDLIFFKDYDNEELYPSNYFVGMILRHYARKLVEIQYSLIDFLNCLEAFDERAIKISKRKFSVLITILEGKDFYEFDNEACEAIQKAKEKYFTYKDLLDDFYKESPLTDYTKFVEKRFCDCLKEGVTDKDSFLKNLKSIYEIDVDFLRFIGYPKKINELHSIYLRYLNEAGLDTSWIVEEPKERYFVRKQSKIFDPKPYLNLSAGEISNKVIEICLPELSEKVKTGEDNTDIKNILRSVGIILTDPIIIAPEDYDSEEPQSNPPKKL